MKKIIHNPNNLKKEEIQEEKKKSRIILINKNKMILIRYANTIMLPGGKKERKETSEEALIRELKEELGIEFKKNVLTPIVSIDHFQKDYPLRKEIARINREVTTDYYYLETDQELVFNIDNLSRNEKNNDFEILSIDLKNILSYIKNYSSENPRAKYFQEDLLLVLKYYFETRKKLIDLHTHSIYSDGELSPEELIKLAKEKNIGTIALTDHDTIAGNLYLQKHGFFIDKEIRVIPGIELSAKVPKGRMHILGYNIDLFNPALNNKMKELQNNSLNSVLSILEQIKRDYGIIFTYDEIKELINAPHNLGRPDIAKLCIKNGYAKTVKEAFDLYLVDAYQKTRKDNKGLSFKECLKLILDSGGIPVLAHPYSLELNEKELLILIKEMISNGLQGIEEYHSHHTQEQIKLYLEIAKKYNLLISGGTDYHGKIVKPDIELGTGHNNNIQIRSLSLLNHLNNKR